MRTELFDPTAPKKPVDVTLNSDLVSRAQDHGIDISAVVEKALAETLALPARAKWDADIAEEIRQHERYVAEHGSLRDAVSAEIEARG